MLGYFVAEAEETAVGFGETRVGVGVGVGLLLPLLLLLLGAILIEWMMQVGDIVAVAVAVAGGRGGCVG